MATFNLRIILMIPFFLSGFKLLAAELKIGKTLAAISNSINFSVFVIREFFSRKTGKAKYCGRVGDDI